MRVPVDDETLAQSFRASRADVVFLQDLEHVGAREPANIDHRRHDEQHERQDHLCGRPPPRHRQKRHADSKKIDEKSREREIGNGDSEHEDEHRQRVRERSLAPRGKRPEPNPERHGKHERGEGEHGADSEPGRDDLLDGSACEAEREPEIAADNAAEIAQELLGERPIEAILRPQTRFERGVSRLIAEQNQNGIAGHELKSAKREDDRHEEHQHDAEDPTESEAQHGAEFSSRRLAGNTRIVARD